MQQPERKVTLLPRCQSSWWPIPNNRLSMLSLNRISVVEVPNCYSDIAHIIADLLDSIPLAGIEIAFPLR